MRTLQETLSVTRAELDAATGTIRRVLENCERDGQRNPTDAESRAVEAASGKVAILKPKLRALEEAYTEQLADEKACEQVREVLPRRGGAQVHSPRTYSRDNDPKGVAFLRDVALDFLGNRAARERLYSHEREERAERGDVLTRAVTSSSAPGLVVPQYLVDLYGPMGRAGRKFADSCRLHDLPETGMTAYIPRQTAKTSVGIQTSENTTVSENDYDDENVSVPIRTAAGSQTVSRQGIERSLGLEQTIFEDLLKAYNTDLDSQLVNATTWGLAAVATTVTWTDTAATAQALYSKVQEAAAGTEAALLDTDEGGTFTLLHGRRWRWVKSQTTDKWPFINSGVPGQAFGTGNNSGYAAAVRGFWPDGGPVVTDNNITTADGSGTNQDQVFVVARQEAHLWEDPNAPMFIRAEQTQAKKLSIDYVLYGYFAALFDRVQDSSKAVHRVISGTGLVTPTF